MHEVPVVGDETVEGFVTAAAVGVQAVEHDRSVEDRVAPGLVEIAVEGCVTIDIEHPAFGRYTTSGTPLEFSAAPNPELGPSPTFGQHTREVLAELGFADLQIEALVDTGVVAAAADDPLA